MSPSTRTRASHALRRRLPRVGWQPFFERVHGWSLAGMGIGSAVWTLDESGEAAFIARFARWAAHHHPVDRPIVCVDVGANEGTYSELLVAALGERAVVHCFEPADDTFAKLTARIGAQPNVELHRAAAGQARGTANLHVIPEHGQLASLYPFEDDPRATTQAVPVEQLDAWADDAGIERIALLKVDVEGAELDTLSGARGLLAAGAIDVVQFEYGARNATAGSTFRDLADAIGREYRMHRLVIDGLRPVDPRREGSDIAVSATNYVAIGPRARALADR